MTEVHMIYTGIIGFWKHHEKDEVWLFAPDARQAHSPHIGWLMSARQQVDPSTSGCDEIDVGQSYRDKYRVFRIFNFFEIEPQVKPERSIGYGNGFPSQLVSLGDLNPNHNGALNIKVVSSVPETPRLTLFKSRLTFGTLSAIHVDPCPWHFEHLPNKVKYLAQAVDHSFEIEQNELEINFGESCKLVLAAQNGKIEVTIGNTMQGDILPPRNEAGQVDHHVLLYHRLVAKSKTPGAKPLVCQSSGPIQASKPAGTLTPWEIASVGGANCPPGWWDEPG